MPSHGTSRNNISLDTGPDKGDNYDQICALSVRTINANFDALWAFRPEEVTKIVFNDGEHGVMTAFMLAPRIKVDPAQEVGAPPVVHFSLRFDKESNIYYNLKQKVDMSGWVITVTASLEELCVTPIVGDDQDTLEDKLSALQPMKRTFILTGRGKDKDGGDVRYDLDQPIKIEPGQYGIHRLFAAISGSSWGKPVWKYSTMPGPEGQPPISLEKWTKEFSVNSELWSRVTDTLEAWARKNQNSAFFTLGYQFKEPEAAKTSTEKKASEICVPFATRLVTYPYIHPKSYDEQIAKNKNETPRGDITGDYNCLVYAETTGTRQLPKRKLLSYGGNLASPANEASKTEVLGTFVLDHRGFFRSQILVLLQEICMGTMVVAMRPSLVPDRGPIPQFTVGVAPPQGPDVTPGQISGKHPAGIATDPYFEFKHVGERKYEWQDSWVAPGSKTETYDHVNHPRKPCYSHWNINSNAKVTVGWESGGHELTVSGASRYYHWQAHSSNNPFPFENMNPDIGFWGEFIVTSKWSFKIDLRVPRNVDNTLEYGVIEPTVEGVFDDEKDVYNYCLPKNLDVTAVDQHDIAKTYDDVRNTVRNALRERLRQLIRSLRAKFRSSGRFVYPATGTLKFGSPMIADNGDVYADVDYVPPQLGGLITLRRPDQMPYTDPLYKAPELVTIPEDPTVRNDVMHLLWQVVAESYDPKTRCLRLAVKGNNLTGTKLAFQRVTVSALVVKPEGNKTEKGEEEGSVVRLFEDEAAYWEAEQTEQQTKPESKLPATAPVSTPAAGEAPTTSEQPKEPQEPEVLEPGYPTPTFLVEAKDIPFGLRPKVDRPANLDFTLFPQEKFRAGRQPRFYVDAGLGLSLTLEGTTPGPGTYVLQLRESWEATSSYEKLPNDLWADAFYSVKLAEDREPVIEIVSAAKAAKIQGVEPE